MDIVVAQTYMRQNEADLGLWPASQSVKKEGTIVLIDDDPEGDINHWIFHAHGKFIGASLWGRKPRVPASGSRLIIFSKYHDKKFENRFPPGVVTWIKKWDEVVEDLKAHHPGKPRVAVLPDATSGIPETAIPK